jgi:hypothetical protein
VPVGEWPIGMRREAMENCKTRMVDLEVVIVGFGLSVCSMIGMRIDIRIKGVEDEKRRHWITMITKKWMK